MAMTPKTGERIAKVLARRGVASRRAAEAMITEGRVAVNGKVIDSPALDVGPKDRITLDGKPLPEAPPPRLWLYHKPVGLVTTEKDEKDRPTVFGALPPELGRVVSVGRLDINSEGLLLLTNDGGLKRKLELPATGWLRKYRVRVNGMPSEETLEPLRKGIEVEGEKFQPMEVGFDRQQGSNAWLTVGIREGRNREVRRAMNAVGLTVNRLIRISYGPFRLGQLKPGEVEEVRAKVLRDQLGVVMPDASAPGKKRTVERAGGKPRVHKGSGPSRGGAADREAPKNRTRKPGASSGGGVADRQPGAEPRAPKKAASGGRGADGNGKGAPARARPGAQKRRGPEIVDRRDGGGRPGKPPRR